MIYSRLWMHVNDCEQKTRLICLIKENLDQIRVRTDPKFPSIWCKEIREYEKNLLIGGFYRESAHDGKKSSSVPSFLVATTHWCPIFRTKHLTKCWNYCDEFLKK